MVHEFIMIWLDQCGIDGGNRFDHSNTFVESIDNQNHRSIDP